MKEYNNTIILCCRESYIIDLETGDNRLIMIFKSEVFSKSNVSLAASLRPPSIFYFLPAPKPSQQL
jgi:hypothetical protein